ncbi:DUF393 domain-containing protein [Virgibacillus proomii]|nr:DUF393 domain-containing protein [Virgibacillus proomii]
MLYFRSFRDKSVLKSLPIPLAELEKEIFSRTERKHIYYQGIDTFIQMNKRIPFLNLSVPLLIISKKLGFGQKIYKYIADNREIFPVNHCSDQFCEINNR